MTQVSKALPGALVVSLDFELHWGVRDRHEVGGAYTRNLLGARDVIPHILELFEEFEIAASWATVGFLFARSLDALMRFSPSLRPDYRDAALSPYAESVGWSELDDPLHFAASIIDRIRRTPRQEIATHTFSHYYCGEDGQTRDTFQADLEAAMAIAAENGIRLRSVVFPRNQHNAAYDDILLQHGLEAYRGNPRSWPWRFANAEQSAGSWRRVGRLADTYVDLGGTGSYAWSDVIQPNGLANVRASLMLRPYDPRLRHLEPLRLLRLRRSIAEAARSRRILHLWWHPHNFGTHQGENLAFLRHLLEEFRVCKEGFGMSSLSMHEVSELARQATGAPATLAGALENEPRPAATRLVHITTIPMSLVFLNGQVGYFKERGFQIHAISSPGPELVAFGETERVPVNAVEMRRRITPLRDLRAATDILKVLRRMRPAIVHAHTPKGGLLGMIAAWLARSPVRIYQMRGLPLLASTGPKRALLWYTEWIACRLAHQVLCVSHTIRDEAVRSGVCKEDKIKVLGSGSGNGVDAAVRFNTTRLGMEARHRVRLRLGIPVDALVAGFIGRIVRDKGIVELANAWRILRDEFPRVHLLMVGPLEPQDPLPPETLECLRDDARVHFAGEDWNTPPLYTAMDILVLPTYREGFPNTPLEAAAMELPVVATRIPGCVDAVVDGVTGTLVPPRDSVALAEALRAYLQDCGRRREHGQAGRRRVLREFRQEIIWEALYGEYLRLLRARHLPAPEGELLEVHQ